MGGGLGACVRGLGGRRGPRGLCEEDEGGWEGLSGPRNFSELFGAGWGGLRGRWARCEEDDGDGRV